MITPMRLFIIAPLFLLASCTTDTTQRDSANAEAAPASDTSAAAAGSEARAGGILDPNTASKDQILGIPGMTAVLADSIVTRRPYASVIDFDRVVAAQVRDSVARDSIYSRLWIPIDLNTATREEILLIPGVGPRMAHEFEEYRPYDAIARFRREIGKYVDANEVARFERYVTIR